MFDIYKYKEQDKTLMHIKDIFNSLCSEYTANVELNLHIKNTKQILFRITLSLFTKEGKVQAQSETQ